MRPFAYVAGTSVTDAIAAVRAAPDAVFLGGGTTLVDLMKLDVLAPSVVVGVCRLPLGTIEPREDGLHVGATVTNTQLAWHPDVRARFPALAEAILAGASPQIRNMATTAGNIMQRTRCPYYRDVGAACNRRAPGTGCAAIVGIDRDHAVLGGSAHCIAVHPSDMCVALALYDAIVLTETPDGGGRQLALNQLHTLPGDEPARESVLAHGELITHVVLPWLPWARQARYLKVRDRASYELPLASAAVALELDDGRVTIARIALGGVATKPWRAWDAERSMVGAPPTVDTFAAAAELALAPAHAGRHNGFKIELAKRTIVRAFTEVAARIPRREAAT